jgi:hypothetical protein
MQSSVTEFDAEHMADEALLNRESLVGSVLQNVYYIQVEESNGSSLNNSGLVKQRLKASEPRQTTSQIGIRLDVNGGYCSAVESPGGLKTNHHLSLTPSH